MSLLLKIYIPIKKEANIIINKIIRWNVSKPFRITLLSL